MQKAICLEQSNKNVVRVLAIAGTSIIEQNPTNSNYIVIEDYTEPPDLDNPLSVNYPMYNKSNQSFKWVQIQYQNTATNELLEIENIKVENSILRTELLVANENINMLTETIADMIGGAI